MQYAAALAIRDVEGVDEAREGVLALSDDGEFLILNASAELWTDQLGVEVDPLNLDNVRQLLFAVSPLSELTLDERARLDVLAQEFWGKSLLAQGDIFYIRLNETDDSGETVTLEGNGNYYASDWIRCCYWHRW